MTMNVVACSQMQLPGEGGNVKPHAQPSVLSRLQGCASCGHSPLHGAPCRGIVTALCTVLATGIALCPV